MHNNVNVLNVTSYWTVLKNALNGKFFVMYILPQFLKYTKKSRKLNKRKEGKEVNETECWFIEKSQ